MRKFILAFVFATVLSGVVALALPRATVFADAKAEVCEGIGLTGDNGTCNQSQDAPTVTGIVSTVIGILSFVVGVVAIIMVIIGGFKYITSGGDSGKVTAAKNTIMYALIGLVIAALSQVIVRFVFVKATEPPTPTTSAQDQRQINADNACRQNPGTAC